MVGFSPATCKKRISRTGDILSMMSNTNLHTLKYNCNKHEICKNDVGYFRFNVIPIYGHL